MSRVHTHVRFSYGVAVAIFLVLHVIFAGELMLDLRHGSRLTNVSSTAELWSALDGSAAMARMSGTTISRAYNVLVSLVLTSVAIAIPLTANMYTPKLIDIFIKDRVNVVVLTFFVLSSAQAIWSTQATWDQGPLKEHGGVYPRVSLWVAFETITMGWSILIPYFYYVFRYLDPQNIIECVSDLVVEKFREAPAAGKGAAVEGAQRDLDQRIMNLGNVILRAIDRADRDVTLAAIHALKRVMLEYQAGKDRFDAAWFRAPAELWVGLSREAVEVIREDRIWVEQKCLHQLALAYNASLAKMQDAISAISDVNRELILDAEAQADVPALRLGIRFFNTFIREAVKRKDVHAIFDVFAQYKELARDLMRKHPGIALEIGRHLKYYADFARLSGLAFIYELAAYELGCMIEWAYEQDVPGRGELLEILLSFDGVGSSVRLAKAKIIAGAFFLERGLEAEAARLRERVASAPARLLLDARRDLLETRDRVFWEVTDRQTNIDYVDDARKKAVAAFLDATEPHDRGAPELLRTG